MSRFLKYHLFILLISPVLISFSQIDSVASARFNGVNFVSTNDSVRYEHIEPIIDLNADWASVIPFAFMPNLNSPDLSYNHKWQWYGERIDGARQMINLMHDQNIKVLLKPQIWVGHGDYTGLVEMKNEKDWLVFESNYTAYIMEFVQVAIELNVEMVAIGTELSQVVKKRPLYWQSLIDTIRVVYNGQLTYAENWDTYRDVPFWNSLNYIGIDAYFPLQKRGRVKKKKLLKSWTEYEKQIQELSDLTGRKIIFTEYGYRSISECAQEPWDHNTNGKYNEQAQKIALETLFDVFWSKDYFVGGFLWKWHPNHDSIGGKHDDGFTVQNKLAEDLVRTIYCN